MSNYYQLGRCIKLNTNLPDSLCAMVRDYCCERPTNNINNFDNHCGLIVKCQHGSFNVTSSSVPNRCAYCSEEIDPNYALFLIENKGQVCQAVQLCLSNCVSAYGVITQIDQSYLSHEMKIAIEVADLDDGNDFIPWITIDALSCCYNDHENFY